MSRSFISVLIVPRFRVVRRYRALYVSIFRVSRVYFDILILIASLYDDTHVPHLQRIWFLFALPITHVVYLSLCSLAVCDPHAVFCNVTMCCLFSRFGIKLYLEPPFDISHSIFQLRPFPFGVFDALAH